LRRSTRTPPASGCGWEQGFYPQADEAVAEIVAAFEQKTGKQVELVQPGRDEILDKVQAAVAAGRPPDFLFAYYGERWIRQYAYEDRLADLSGTLGSVLALFDTDAVEASTLFNDSTGRRGLYALPIGRHSNNIHVWNSLLERADLTLADIPQDWDAFWTFWCDQVQPAVRKASGRDSAPLADISLSVCGAYGAPGGNGVGLADGQTSTLQLTR
jgi:multiple sugar transport system substrate-binding protein